MLRKSDWRLLEYIIGGLILVALVSNIFIKDYLPEDMAQEIRRKYVIQLWEYPRWRYKGSENKFGWMEERIKEFESENSDVEIRLTKLSWKEGQTKIKISFLSGDMPDIFPATLRAVLTFIDNGLIEDITEEFSAEDREDYLKSSIDSMTYNGKIWGIPWFITGEFFYLNKKLFYKNRVKLPRGGEWTYSEFIKKLSKISKPEKNIYGCGFALEPNTTYAIPFLYMDGGRVIDENNEYVFDSEVMRENLKRLYDMIYKYRIMAKDFAGMGSGDLWQAFFKEQTIAASPWGLWALSYLQKQKFEVDIAAPPSGKDGKSYILTATSGFFITKQKDNEKKKYIIKFLKYLTDSTNQKILSEYGTFPTRKSTGNIYKKNFLFSKANKLIKKYGYPKPTLPIWDNVLEKIERQLQLYLLGNISLGRAVTSEKEGINNLLKIME